jgi:O-acetyl-ADP-ribose deacetylase (regulator of RNase III)
MIHEVTGDILLSSAQAIAHGVAPHDHFDHGLALGLRTDWPAMAKDFRHYCHLENPKPGTLWAWAGVGGHRVVCLLTQEPVPANGGHPGKASTSNVNHALHALRQFILTEKITSLALPKLATGVGGLSWAEVHPLVVKHLGDLSLPIFVYTTYHQGMKAVENLPTTAA